MLKKIIFVILSLSLLKLQAMDPPLSDETTAVSTKPKPAPIVFEDNEGSPCMRSIKTKDLEKYKEQATASSSIEETIPFRVSLNLSDMGACHYHMMAFTESVSSDPIAFFDMRKMPIFTFPNGADYGKDDVAIIEKWKSLGVRQTGSDHDERVENFGLLNWIPIIPSSVPADSRKLIYQKMLAHSKRLRAAGFLMTSEKDPSRTSVCALPNHVVVILPRESGDIVILQELGFEADEKAEYAKFLLGSPPSVMLTCDISPSAASK